ncbi:protein of unknown function [Streptantibioticus cattleyicolor NRRL 8057 = DSM 46488]|nr:protein of unknown function [Streptantibioticus cattleyicolor NRRL 8057 = DSM 46488]
MGLRKKAEFHSSPDPTTPLTINVSVEPHDTESLRITMRGTVARMARALPPDDFVVLLSMMAEFRHPNCTMPLSGIVTIVRAIENGQGRIEAQICVAGLSAEVTRLVRYPENPLHGRDSLHSGVPRPTMCAASLAARLAGSGRPNLSEEWAAILAGEPEKGVVLSTRRQWTYVCGFLWAALRMRLHDVLQPAWAPVDWILATQSRSHGFVCSGVGALAIYIDWHDGLHSLLTDGWEWCGACGTSLALLVRWLRRTRGIELATAAQHNDPEAR